VDREFHARWEKLRMERAAIEMALRALDTHRAWNSRSTGCHWRLAQMQNQFPKRDRIGSEYNSVNFVNSVSKAFSQFGNE